LYILSQEFFFILLGVLQFIQRQRIGIDDFVLMKGHLRAKVEIEGRKSTKRFIIKVYEYQNASFYTYDKSVISNKDYLYQNMYSDVKDWTEDSVKFHVLKNRFGSSSSPSEIYSLSNYKETFFDLRSKWVGEYLPTGTVFFLAIGLLLGAIFIWVSIVKYRRIVIKQRKVNN
jgi:hypothetical protein